MSVSPDNVEGTWQIFKSVIMSSIKTYISLCHVVNNFSPRQYPTYIQRAIKQKRVLWRDVLQAEASYINCMLINDDNNKNNKNTGILI